MERGNNHVCENPQRLEAMQKEIDGNSESLKLLLDKIENIAPRLNTDLKEYFNTYFKPFGDTLTEIKFKLNAIDTTLSAHERNDGILETKFEFLNAHLSKHELEDEKHGKTAFQKHENLCLVVEKMQDKFNTLKEEVKVETKVTARTWAIITGSISVILAIVAIIKS